ncbi:LuxR family transcriptional regulator [Dulcicalothrix desertica PCC 7102]|uniref:LuxR family transcriptional regulator n=1 Tax=Dulcicalothrix desertica PCC 7102 TaxID=232991 RepID=A0A3S1C6R3_9CYAN|nr:LuxR C-terminal-related transcriptional regulator [Dulcicalothrix desertica]RUS97605.1 LuxR family transcriptional regulator [Dulcicalothrix desertica PCC 7102]TWH54815.1 Response regulator containing a CheY-like receiver domain and an HTH DNA-binding domain [Dulcicalothrix desertica PCC 7102]
MAPNTLQSLLAEIQNASDEYELKQYVKIRAGQYFAAKRSSLFFLSEMPLINKNTPKIIKLALSVEHNPVLRYLVENHAPVHEELLLPPGAWNNICPRGDHGHVMAGPIISNGHLIGGVGFTRNREDSPFDSRNIADLTAMSLHLSTWLTTKQLETKNYNPSNYIAINKLTAREVQIAELVSQGLTNAEIGAKLWIQENSVKQALKRMFRKLDVASRAEMVGKLFATTNRI